jgi:hypothetical protein
MLGIRLRALHMLGSHTTAELHIQPSVVTFFFFSFITAFVVFCFCFFYSGPHHLLGRHSTTWATLPAQNFLTARKPSLNISLYHLFLLGIHVCLILPLWWSGQESDFLSDFTVQIPALPLTSCVTLGRFTHPLYFGFLICKIEINTNFMRCLWRLIKCNISKILSSVLSISISISTQYWLLSPIWT